ncbi:acyltransferase [Chitinophaga sp. 30R24]|uniref:acyltransferase n=1 Tax=Chitinophaga sp. 30R24 TaxID=3248838 RepID=UPI003B8F15BC
MEHGDSIFFDNFHLDVRVPVAGKKFLKVGKDSVLNCEVIFESGEGKVVVGDRVFIGGGQIISRSKIEFEDDIFVAWGGCIYDHDSHSLDYKERQNDLKQQLIDIRQGKGFIKNKNWSVVNTKPIKICSNVWIGMNCLILKGVTIGEGAIIGAGSVVTKDVAPWTVVAGNPARLIKVLPDHLRRS